MPLQAMLVVAWMAYVTNLKDYLFRANLYAFLLEVAVAMYAVNVRELKDVLTSCITLIIVLGLYELPRLLWLPTISSLFIVVFHVFVLKSVDLSNGFTLQLALQLLAIPLTIYVVKFLTTEEQKNKKRMLESIEELKITQRSKDDFLANVSHELRTPINTICGMSEIVSREDLSPEVQESLRSIHVAGKNLLSVVTDILDFSELQSGKISLAEETFNITSTINDVINITLAKIGDKKIDFLVDVDANIPCGLNGDEQKLRRVILSLIDNAVKFTDEGYVKFGVGFRKEGYGINLCVVIKDTGIGMRAENLSKIFADFTQVNGKRNREESGIGLGLSIAQAIVEIMGGFITVNSTYGVGTEVQVVVPMVITDGTPIAKVKNASELKFASYLNRENFTITNSRDEYADNLVKMAKQIGVKSYICQTLGDLKKRTENENLTHVFIGTKEYREDSEYFDNIAKECMVVVFISPGEESIVNNAMLVKIYRPMFIVPIVNIVNDRSRHDKALDMTKHVDRFVMPDAHILAVDDSFMNVKVLEGLLRTYGLKLTTASSGPEALQKIRTRDYDFVFMDHMMPGMDGIECKHKIRNMEGTYYKSVPIVALTANAVAGTREMFLEEGFDDFISKPVEISGLERILKKFVPEEKIKYIDASEMTEQLSPVTGSSGDTLEFGDFDVKKGLLYCGSEENYIDILKMHRQNGEANKNDIIGFYKNEDWDNYTIYVHALKSSMMSIGAEVLSSKAKRLEQAGKEHDAAYITANHDDMIKEYERVLTILANSDRLKSESEETVDVADLKSIDDSEFDEFIKKFEDAVYTFDPANMYDLVDTLEERQYNGHALREYVTAVRRKIDMSDYMSAVDVISAVRDRYRNR